MTELTATFEIESRSDARSIGRALDELHNRLREEDLAARDDRTDGPTLESFDEIRRAVEANEADGELVVAYRSASAE